MKSKKFALNVREIVKGFILAAIGAVLSTSIEMLNSGTINFKIMLTGALVAGLSYLSKTYFEQSNG